MKKAVPARFRAAAAVLLVLFALPAAATASPAASLQERLAAALRVKHVSLAMSGATVIDLQTGETLFAENASHRLLPASNEKLAITYVALTELGPDFRIETDVLGTGQLEGNVWHGDLFLKGYGDPTLSSARLATLAGAVRGAGIEHVTGRVIGDESWFDSSRTAPGWKPEFYLHESPALSALIVNRGWTGRAETRQPALAAAQLFRRALANAGVHVNGSTTVAGTPDDAETVTSVESPTVAALVRFMDRNSDNFTAEMLLKEVGAVHGAGGTTADGVAVETAALAAAGVPLSRVHLVDGSGLSLLDRWTPSALTALLRVMWLDPDVRPYLLASLPVAGETGTLAHRMRAGPARGLVHGKTGTTNNASALSGIVGDRYAFSVLQNGWPVSAAAAERSQDRFASVLAASTLSG
jgi:D-alanyl-D-alanine carboxypeptidase/D-alanyl-D-alanine-endopeptidase (penicillin-binding protein 4)